LDNLDYDIYLVNVNTGAITNLTPNGSQHDIRPSWTLNGTKIFFLSTLLSPWAGEQNPGPCNLKNDIPHQMKIISTDGNNEQVIYKELYYPFVAISNKGQIAFVTDMVSKTKEEYWNSNSIHLYTMGVDDLKPMELSTKGVTLSEFRPIIYSWSSDGRRLLYIDKDRRLKIVNINTGEVRFLPSIEPYFEREEDPEMGEFSWSPDSQQIATTVFVTRGGDIDGSYDYGYDVKFIYLLNLQDDTVHSLIQK
jgi:dipeptidyl aminopeptidase/acylaminoacyl peptidase